MQSEVYEFIDPDPVQLHEMHEAEEAVQRCLVPEHLNEIFMFRGPELEQLNEGSGFREAALNEDLPERGALRIVH